ncbi:carboxypeptidase regulatory-like domain-containing protein [Terrabacter sp. AAH1]
MSLRALPSDRSPVRHRLLLLLTVVALFVGQGVAGSAPARAAATAAAPTIASAQLATASGLVSAADGSGPIAGVVVKALTHGSADFTPVATATTGSTGAWTMTDLPPGDYDLQFDASDTAYLSQWWSAATTRDRAGVLSATAGVTLSGLDASLTRAATVSGRVVDESGTPLADVLVTPREQSAGAVTRGAVITAADGTFTVRGLTAGTYTLDFSGAGRVSWSYGMASATAAPAFFAVAEGTSVSGRVMVLPAGSTMVTRGLLAAADTTATMSGHVYAGSTASPLTGALVVAVAADSDGLSSGVLNATTDATGAWTLTGLSPDVYTVHVLPPAGSDYLEQWWDAAPQRSHAAYAVLGASGARTDMDATLVQGGSISGKVTAGGTFGVADVVVQAAPVGTETWSSVVTDGDGNFTLVALRPDQYVVQFDGRSLGFEPAWWSGTSQTGVATRSAASPVAVTAGAAAAGHDIVMAQAGSIFGTVTGPNATPVADVPLEITDVDSGITSSSITDVGGNFVAGGLTAGRYLVRVTPLDGSQLASQWFDGVFSRPDATPVIVENGLDNRIDFSLVPSGTISGRVLRPGGAPAATGSIMVAPASDPTFTDVVAVNPLDGTFSLSGLGPGDYLLSAVDDGTLVTYYATSGSTANASSASAVTLAAGAAVSGRSITLAPGASISGRVTEGSTGAPFGQIAAIDVRTGAQLGASSIGGSGSYTMTGLPAGTYAVMATGTTDVSRWFGNTTTWADSTFVSLAGGTARTGVDISLPAAGIGPVGTSTFSGHITLPAGAATTDFSNLSVGLVDAAGLSYSTFSINADGTFDIFDVPDGSLTMHLVDLTQELFLAPQPVTTPTSTLEVQPVVGASIAGALVNEAGKPLANVDVGATSDAGVTASTLSGPDGNFRISGLPAGTVRLHLGPASPYASTWVGGGQTPGSGTLYDLTLGSTTDAAQLTVPLGGTITGTVTLPADAQGTEVIVEALDAHHDVVGATTVVGTHAYELAGLLPGVFTVRFSGPGMATQQWSAPGSSGPSDVIVAAGRTAGNVDATLAPPTGTASVAGTITAQGNPALRARVTLVQPSDGHATASAISDAAGHYVVSGVPAGDYKVQVQSCLTSGPATAGPLCVTRWWKVATDFASAPPISVASGEARPGVDVELSSMGLFTSSPAPTITGTPRVGVALGVTDGSWSPPPGTLSHRWLVGGVAVGTSTSYTPQPQDVGKTVVVETTATRAGFASRTTRSAATAAVLPGNLTGAPVPTISGTVRVGLRLTATAGTWGPAPVTLAYQWRRNGVAIPGATASTHLLGAADRATTISVTVTAAKTGYTTVAKTSAATATVAAGVLTAPVPKITGTVKVGYRLTATAGTWGPLPVTVKYQWRRNGVAITGASASTYLLTAADRTARMTVTVTGMKTGYTTAAKTSAATLAVATGTLTATPMPKITGTTRVGSRLTATAGTWSPAPVTLKYQWRRNGVAITGATASTYVIASSMRGARITVTVTGAKTGYTSVARTSTATAVIS